MDKGGFIGRDALAKVRAQGATRKLCCITLDNPDAVVMGKEPIMDADRVLGYVTSANYGHTIGRGIVYGYLPIDYSRMWEPAWIFSTSANVFPQQLPASLSTIHEAQG